MTDPLSARDLSNGGHVLQSVLRLMSKILSWNFLQLQRTLVSCQSKRGIWEGARLPECSVNRDKLLILNDTCKKQETGQAGRDDQPSVAILHIADLQAHPTEESTKANVARRFYSPICLK